jgi:hypothetical protein
MTILEIIDLPIYKQMSGREKWRNHHVNNGLRKQSTGSLDLISNKGDGYFYILENDALPNWFKAGITNNESNFQKRMASYKSIIPIGEWNLVYFEYTNDAAKTELKIKQFFRYECEYEMGINSKEWFKGDWKEMQKIIKFKNTIEYKPNRRFVKDSIRYKNMVKQNKNG